MPTKSVPPMGQEEELTAKVVVVPDTCPEVSPFTQEKDIASHPKIFSDKHATPDSKIVSYDVATRTPPEPARKKNELNNEI
jgi:hypothetical protein